jgi:hypothetical protein
MPAIGIWDAFDPVGAPAIGAAPASTAWPPAKPGCASPPAGDDMVRIGIADQRGDGRPDYAYNGWVLYADTVQPQRLPASGGPIVIHGMGFRLADTVLVGGQPAMVTSISPNEITAIAPPAATGVTGSVDVEVDDLPALLRRRHPLRRRQLRLRRGRRAHPAHRAHRTPCPSAFPSPSPSPRSAPI